MAESLRLSRHLIERKSWGSPSLSVILLSAGAIEKPLFAPLGSVKAQNPFLSLFRGIALPSLPLSPFSMIESSRQAH